MPRVKSRLCRVCGIPCVGFTCRDCHHTKNNKIAGRYKNSGFKLNRASLIDFTDDAATINAIL